MYIHGSFMTQRGDTVTVHIVTNQDRATEMEIGGADADLYFTDDPCEISDEVNDTFDVLLRRSASIRLLARNYVSDFFCANCRDAVVNIYKNDACVYAGFIEPMSYSQSYNETYDELELSCIDALAALQYSKYKSVGASGVTYEIVKAEAKQRTFGDIATEILSGVTAELDIVGGGVKFLYDGSKAIDAAAEHAYSVFTDLSVSELLFLGDEEDDVWEQDAVLEELLKYLNLHILQDGLTFYIFDWATVKATDSIQWGDLGSGHGAATTETTTRGEQEITTANAADTDTQISVDEVYNQLLLTCDIEDVENVIESPLDDDLLTPAYTYGKQLYCTEYSSDGEGKKAYRAFYAMTHGGTTDYGSATVTDWYVKVMKNSLWQFPYAGGDDLIEDFCGEEKKQHRLPNYLAANHGAAIMAWGKVQQNMSKQDNSLVSSVSMTNYLVMSVNGNEVDNDEENTYPSVADIKARIPFAVYTGNGSGVFSPTDDDTTNYIVFSGKITLNPIMAMTADYTTLHDDIEWQPGYWHKTVPSRNNGDGRYYTRKYYMADTPRDTATWDNSITTGLAPFTGEGPEQYEFKYSGVGDNTDKVSKIAVLACMLVIGDKCVVEHIPDSTDEQGKVNTFTWETYKTLDECADEDEYYAQSFTLGFNPAVGDKLIGTEFDFQNNIDYKMGVDAEGIAIPIKKTDKVSGNITFKILGPVNTTWDEITRRHPTFFRHTKWSTSTVPLLAHVSSIMVKEFECKVYSDNGGYEGDDSNDVIYMSDTTETYVNKKDDLEFKICSALTTAECKELGVKSGVNLSTPTNADSGDGVQTIYDRKQGIEAKAEQFYVDSYYTEYHTPHVLMEQNLLDDGGISPFNHYTHPAIGKRFFVQGVGYNLMEGTASLTLKEI